jgi:cobalt/nickel transport system permease protein
MWALSAATIGFAVTKLGHAKTADDEPASMDESKIPLMGIMGAFVFAAQMINFTIPGTGSSGHICGGVLLAALLGPWAAVITIASVILIQCLVFADGGLLAYGCNVFNMGITGALIAYSLIYRPIVSRAGGGALNKKTISIGAILACVIGLQIGAFCVTLETLASGISALPFTTFLLLLQPIHLAIGLVEGLITAAILCFVEEARPEMLKQGIGNRKEVIGKGNKDKKYKRVLAVFAVAAALTAGGLSIFASTHPDGLEWSISKITGSTELKPDARKAPLDYGPGTGLAGSAITLALAGGAALTINVLRKRRKS